MATAPRPVAPRPAPPRSTVPAAPPVAPIAAAPVAAAPAPVNPVAPAAPAPVAPVNAAPVAPVNAAPVAPVNAAPVAPVDSTAPAAPEKKKRGRQKGQKVASTLAPWGGVFAWNPDNTPIMDTDGEGNQVHRAVKLESVPALVSTENPGGFDYTKHLRLKPRQFKRIGDFYRHEAQVYQARAQAALNDAAAADAGKTKQRTSKAAVLEVKMSAMFEQLKALMSPEAFAAWCAANGYDIPA